MDQQEQQRVARVETTAGEALDQSRALLREFELLRPRLITRTEQDAAAAHENSQRAALLRNVRKLVTVTVIALLLVVAGVVRSVVDVNDANQRLDTELLRLQNLAMTNCLARNNGLIAERQLWQTFIDTEDADISQPPEVRALKVQNYTDALELLPEPVDCSDYAR